MTHRRAVSSGTTFLSNLIASPFPAPKSANTTKGGDNLHLFDFVTKGMCLSFGYYVYFLTPVKILLQILRAKVLKQFFFIAL